MSLLRRLDTTLSSLHIHQQEVVDLSEYAALKDAGVATLCTSLFGHAPLRELRLAAVGIGVTGATHVAEIVAVHLRLRVLELSRNAIHDEGTAAIANALGSSAALERLELSMCDVGDAGAAALSAALLKRRLAPLTHLDLSLIHI